MSKKSKIFLAIYFIFWITYFSYFWSQSIFTDPAGNIVANHINIWGDWAAHFTMGSRMAYDQLFLKNSPFLITSAFSYPFAADLISALLVRAGVNFFEAFIIPSLIFSITTVWALFYFYKKIFKSVATAITASLLFLLNGGLGFIYFIKDIIEANDPLSVIINPPQQYTNIEPLLYRWISVIDSMIIPQRAFGLGFSLTLIALASCFSLLNQSKQYSSWKKLLLPILLLGLMPVIHTHSFLAAFIILAIWASGDLIINSFKRVHLKRWLMLLIGVCLIALPIIKVFFYPQISEEFIKWFPGWYSHDFPDENWLLFWIKNWGLIPLLASLGWTVLLRNKNKSQRQLSLVTFLPFFIIFILLNLFLFQPFIWDNTKLVVWVGVGFSGLAAHYLVSMWHQQRKYAWAAKLLIIVIFSISIFAGSIDAYRAIRFKLHSHIMYTQEEVELSSWTKDNTDSRSIWLTGENHNHWLYNLTGRQALMTYRGWLWTHGYQYHDLEKDVTQMFAHPQKSTDLFKKYSVDYIVVGPNEKNVWHANEAELDQFNLVKSSLNYKIYSL